MTNELRQLQALLFLAGEPVSYKELGQLINASAAQAAQLAGELQTALADHGLAVVTTDTHAQLTTSPSVTEYLQQFLQGSLQQLSAAAAETLTVIAYRGPITRADVEAIRGVDCRRMIRQLVVRGLLRRQKQPNQLPRYSVSEEFLQHLGLTNAAQLPNFKDLSQHAKIEQLLARQN